MVMLIIFVERQEKHFLVNVTQGDIQWELTRDFSDFISFSHGLKIRYPQIQLPPFPSNSYSENSLETLNKYIQAVAIDPILTESVEALIFLEIYANVPLANKPKILIPVPDHDFDPSEVGIPWKLMKLCGYEIEFATEHGAVAQADTMLTRDSGVVFGQLGAKAKAKQCYFEMEKDPNFLNPICWADIVPSNYQGVLLGGGHAPRMKQYLENKVLQDKIAEYWQLNRPLAAVCHGVLLLARCKTQGEVKSLLHGRQTTSLPKYMETLGYALTFWKYGNLYRTYKMHCETEIKGYLASPTDFIVGPTTLGDVGTLYDDKHAHIVEDGNYVSGRWPGDAYALGKRFITKVNQFMGANAEKVDQPDSSDGVGNEDKITAENIETFIDEVDEAAKADKADKAISVENL